MIINISGVWKRAEYLHTRYLVRRINDGLAMLSAHVGPGIEHKLYLFIEAHKDLILATEAKSFDIAVNDYEIEFNEHKDKAKLILNRIFDYSAFITFSAGWNAYKLCERALFKFCPYCQIAGTETRIAEDEEKKYRPNLDHFLGKSDYPFLALTLGNLIPCCEKCNGPQMKGQVDFFSKPHLNPLVDQEVINFSLRPRCRKGQITAAVLGLQLNENAYKIHLSIASAAKAQAANSIRTFQLNSRYQSYTVDALNLARQLKSQSRIKALNEKFPQLDIRVEDYISVYTAGDYRNFHGGKMRLDILRQFG